MNELQVFHSNGKDVVDSRDVAEMVGKSHAHLMRDISGYAQVLEKSNESKFGLVDFFIPHTYQDSKGETRPCYLLTKKGCDMVANKMTGEKGVLFTAAYVTAFEKMRERIKSGKTKRVGMTDYQQMMAETRRRNARVQSARLLTQLAKRYEGTSYEQVLNAHATRELTGEYLLPLPQLREKTYSAEEIGAMLGGSANRVGRIANANGLKNKEYGAWFNDKARGHSKEVPSFRYYERAIPVIRELLTARDV